MDWIYKAPGENVDPEQYLLGRKIDKSFELQRKEIGTEGPCANSSSGSVYVVEHEINPESVIKKDGCNVQVDLKRKMLEDPLLQIRQHEEAAKCHVTANPIKMQQLNTLLESLKKAERKQKKQKKKRKKENRKEAPEVRKKKKKAKSSDKKSKKSKYISSSDDSSSTPSSSKCDKQENRTAHMSRKDTLLKRKRDTEREKVPADQIHCSTKKTVSKSDSSVSLGSMVRYEDCDRGQKLKLPYRRTSSPCGSRHDREYDLARRREQMQMAAHERDRQREARVKLYDREREMESLQHDLSYRHSRSEIFTSSGSLDKCIWRKAGLSQVKNYDNR